MMTEDNIIDIWVGMKEFIEKKALETAASKYVDILADNGVSDHILKAAIGGDEDLDAAIEYYLDDALLEEDEDIDINWDEDE
jgi:hypothetical protein